jgi:hypothetical protein
MTAVGIEQSALSILRGLGALPLLSHWLPRQHDDDEKPDNPIPHIIPPMPSCII